MYFFNAIFHLLPRPDVSDGPMSITWKRYETSEVSNTFLRYCKMVEKIFEPSSASKRNDLGKSGDEWVLIL